MPPDSRFGFPLQPLRVDSLDSVLIVDPTLGLDVATSPVNVPTGATPYSENYIIRDGALEPRPMLVPKSTNSQPVDLILGGAEIVDTTANRYPFVTGSTRPAWYSLGSWSVLSYVSAYGVDLPPAGGTSNYYDVAQIYDATSNQNLAIFANGSQQSLFCWQSNTTVYSTLTGAPPAKYIAAFNDYLVAFNLGNGLVQRVQWNDRGSTSSWTGGLSGFADLLDMRGQGTRIVAQDNRLVLFSDYEVWGGTQAAFPFVLQFSPIDKNVGCPYPWTIANTPAGLVFLSNDYNLYLLDKYGYPARAIGAMVQKYLRDNLDQPQRAWATYDRTYNQYQLYFPIRGGSGYPQQALYLNIAKVSPGTPLMPVGQDAFALQTFDKLGGNLSVTRGFEAQLSSTATTWTNLTNAGILWNSLSMTWAQLQGVSETRAQHVGSSKGTMYTLDSNATTDSGTTVRSLWRSSALFGFQPNRQKTVGRIRIDYQALSASTLSVEVSRTQGASFDPAVTMALPPNSAMSEGITHVYTAARYPMFQVSSEAQRYRLFRFWLSVRAGGR